jgi:hypothetical protein
LNCDADTSSDILSDTQQEKTLFCDLLEMEKRKKEKHGREYGSGFPSTNLPSRSKFPIENPYSWLLSGALLLVLQTKHYSCV